MRGRPIVWYCTFMCGSALVAATTAEEIDAVTAGDRSLLAKKHSTVNAVALDDLCRCVGAPDSAVIAKFEQALSQPLKSSGFDFVDTPLAEIVSFLSSEYQIPVLLDTPALDEIGLGPDEPASISLHNVSLRSALRLLLQQLGLTYVIENEVLMITTPEEAETALVTCVFEVSDLIPEPTEAANNALIETITSCIATESWAVHGGGEAAIRSLRPGMLVVSQTQHVHEEIRRLLAAVRVLRAARPGSDGSAAAHHSGKADELVTRFFAVQVAEARGSDEVRNQLRNLITQSLPDEQWSGRLGTGEAVILVVLPDRIVVRHRAAVVDAVENLLAESGVATSIHGANGEVAEEGFGGGAMGGGGGFFEPAPQVTK